MKKAQQATRARTDLDRRFKAMRPTSQFAPPVTGWIKAIREALGMSTAQLAKRLNIRQPTLVAMEQSEAKGTIQLATLRRVAEALDCTLAYALVPTKPLETIVTDRARKVARRRLQSVAHTMLLENQGVDAKEFEGHLDAFIRDMNPRKLWDEP